jgi:hypothetical protein
MYEKDKDKISRSDNISLCEGVESLALPSEFDGAVYQAAMDLDEVLSKNHVAEGAV